MPKIKDGYVLLARKILLSDIMDKPPLWLKLWVWMIEKANHKDGYKGLKRGQFFTTMKELQMELSWHVGGRHNIPTYDQIRAPLRHWSRRPPEDRSVTISKTTRGMIITILNYNKYQDPQNYENHTEDRPKTARRPPASRKSTTVVGLNGVQQELQELQEKEYKYTKKVPIPINIKLTNKMKIYANSKGVFNNLEDIFEDFHDWHLKNNSKHADWLATWRSWIRKHIEFKGKDHKPIITTAADMEREING